MTNLQYIRKEYTLNAKRIVFKYKIIKYMLLWINKQQTYNNALLNLSII